MAVHMTTIRVTKCEIFPFTVRGADGAVDLTSPVTPGSSTLTALRTVINPSNPREAAACMISMTGVNLNNPIVAATITFNGHTAQTNFTAAAAPDLTSVTIGTPSGEVDVPDWALAQL